MILKNLRIKNFRLFEDLEFNRLGRINLLVGKNNSGKSTVLEALRIYATVGSPKLLQELLKSHNKQAHCGLKGSFLIILLQRREKRPFPLVVSTMMTT